MPLRRVQVQVSADSTLPRDVVSNTFHLNEEGTGGDDLDALAEDVCDLWATWYLTARQIECNIYPVGPPPQYPIGHFILNEGLAPASSGPREVALCLSYYGERNLPRTRGRMYFGVSTAGRGLSDVRPTAAIMDPLLLMADGIAALGGIQFDWQVYSPTSGDAENVQHAYVDDEWDTIRSRGLRPTTRVTTDISE